MKAFMTRKTDAQHSRHFAHWFAIIAETYEPQPPGGMGIGGEGGWGRALTGRIRPLAYSEG
jgi:hypothetical protein